MRRNLIAALLLAGLGLAAVPALAGEIRPMQPPIERGGPGWHPHHPWHHCWWEPWPREPWHKHEVCRDEWR